MTEQLTQTTPQGQDNGLYPIRTVSAMTGVNPITLRAWERRYNLITPERTPKGHRLYTRDDIDRIQRVTALLNQGISISQVKPLLDQQQETQVDIKQQPLQDIWDQYLKHMLDAICNFDEKRLDNIYNDALSLYPVDLVSARLINPLLTELGIQWKQRDTGIAEEHFFSVYLRNKLGSRIQHMNQRANGPLLLIACLPGELHETGMLLFSLAAIHHGFRTLILGANLPLEQIPKVIGRRPCNAVVLSGFSKPGKDLLDIRIPQLVREISVPVFIGGALAVRYEDIIRKAGAIPVGSDIHGGIESIAVAMKA